MWRKCGPQDLKWEGPSPGPTFLCALEPAAPWQVIAITFTNKAAGELKQRLEEKIGPDARDVWAAK